MITTEKMMNVRRWCAALAWLGSVGLVGCSSSSDDTDTSEVYPSGYFQVYNGVSGSPALTLSLDDSAVFSVYRGQSSPVYSYTPDSFDYSLEYLDADKITSTWQSGALTLNQGEKTIFVLAGTVAAPELKKLTFARQEWDEQFALYGLNLVQGTWQFYISKSTEDFSQAVLINQTDDHWLASGLTLGEYVLYASNDGNTAQYQSSPFYFQYETEYAFVFEANVLTPDYPYQLTVLSNSSSVNALADSRAQAQLRVYNSIDHLAAVNLQLDDGGQHAYQLTATSDLLTDYQAIAVGDYMLNVQSASTEVLSNRLLSITAGALKTLVLYQGDDEAVHSVQLSVSPLQPAFSRYLTVMNTLANSEQLALYFVSPGETIDAADSKLTQLSQGDSETLTIAAKPYVLVLVDLANSQDPQLLYRSDTIDFSVDQPYLLVTEADASSATGYRVSVLH